MWKSSYRLVLDKAGKTALQGWAILENTSDEDWNDVRLALVSSRPISFQMDLYPLLFVPRPVVEPERFASLRPPEYQGPLMNYQNNMAMQGGNRIRTSLDKVPANTGLHKRYLEKLDKLETEIETLQKQIKENQEKGKKQSKEFEKYLAELTVE